MNCACPHSQRMYYLSGFFRGWVRLQFACGCASIPGASLSALAVLSAMHVAARLQAA